MEQTSGSKIQQQLKEIEKKYKLTKVKRGIYMIERELTDDEKIENQNYNKNRTYIEPMIYELLGNLKKNFIIMDMHELMEEIEIVNKDFNYIKWHTKNVAKAISQNEDTLKIFTKESEPKYDINKLKKKFNAHIQDKLSKSKQGKMKVLTKDERKVYIKYCIDTNQDFNLRKIK